MAAWAKVNSNIMKITDKNMKKWVDLLESDIQQEALDRPFLYDVEDEPPVVTVG